MVVDLDQPAVVGEEHDERVLGEAQHVECVQDVADALVHHLHHRGVAWEDEHLVHFLFPLVLSTQLVPCFAFDVRREERDETEERPLAVLLDKADRLQQRFSGGAKTPTDAGAG